MKGKRILCVGDSIALAMRDRPDEQGLRGWAKHIAAAYGCGCINEAFSAAALNSKTRVRNWGEKAFIAKQIREHQGEHFDAVLIHGGINDAWDDIPLGEIGDSFDPQTFDPTTFAGALEYTFYTAVECFGPQVKLGWIINFDCPKHSVTSNAEEYYEWGKKVCEKWGVPYLDLFHLPYDTKILNQDLIHPNTYGYDYLGAIIVPFVRKMKPCEMK